MISLLVSRGGTVLFIAVLAAHGTFGAESPSRAPANANLSRNAAVRPGSTQNPLPDPLLLDGSTLPVEKKSDVGMIGDFELPGDENVRSGRVGGPQNPNPSAAGGTGELQPTGLPAARSGGGSNARPVPNPSASPSARSPGAPSGQLPRGGGTSAGAPDGEPSGAGNPSAGEAPPGGAGDKGGPPQGMQVTELGGGAGAESSGGGGDSGGKPRPVAIGDSRMRIEPADNSSAPVVGATPLKTDGHIQQHEKPTGTGGKPPTSPQGPGRIEKGRTMPAGL